MSVEFQEDNNFILTKNQNNKSGGGMNSWLIKKGLAKSKQSANYILIGFVIFCIIASILIFKINNSPPSVVQIDSYSEIDPFFSN